MCTIGPYIQEVTYMGWVQLSSLVRPTTLGPHAALVPKATIGHLYQVYHRSQRRSSDIQTAHTIGSLYSKSYLYRFGSTILPGQAQNTGTKCAICHKVEAMTFELHAPSGPYIQEVIYIGLVQQSSLVHHQSQRQSQDNWTACAMYWSFAHFWGGGVLEGGNWESKAK